MLREGGRKGKRKRGVRERERCREGFPKRFWLEKIWFRGAQGVRGKAARERLSPPVWTEREALLSGSCPSEFPSCPHPTDGYSTVDRRERRARGSASAGETSEKELLKVSGCG